MKDQTLIRAGAVGAIIAAICCATPVLVIALGTIGLSAWAAGIDYVVIPALLLSLGLLGFGLYRQSRAAPSHAVPPTRMAP